MGILRRTLTHRNSALYPTPTTKEQLGSAASQQPFFCPQNLRRPPPVPLPPAAGGLGQRLADAFAGAFAEGAYRVVIVGSDIPSRPRPRIAGSDPAGPLASRGAVVPGPAPGITAAVLEGAFKTLAAGVDVAFGPAADGGYYLVALPRGRRAGRGGGVGSGLKCTLKTRRLYFVPALPPSPSAVWVCHASSPFGRTWTVCMCVFTLSQVFPAFPPPTPPPGLLVPRGKGSRDSPSAVRPLCRPLAPLVCGHSGGV